MNAIVARQAQRRRGGPLAMLGTLVLVWVIFRVVSWAPVPFDLQMPHRDHGFGFGLAASDEEPEAGLPAAAPSVPALAQAGTSLLPRLAGGSAPSPSSAVMAAASGEAQSAAGPYMMAGHNILLMAGLSHVPVPDDVASLFRERGAANGPPTPPVLAERAMPQRGKRWSLDSWLFLRDGSGGASAAAPLASTYGASQAGAVLRYRLAAGSAHQPNAYFRAYKALDRGGEVEAALGLAARPLADLPVMANAELRATRVAGKTHLRPAGFVYSQLAPLSLPAGMRAEAYGQAGYVGGAGKTGFVDGQLRLDRELARFKLGDLRAGAGAWGGAQKGAARLDIGPSASIGLPLGQHPARLSMDYRMRVGGDAQPEDGIAITLFSNF
ncbi:MAG: hypothetical protein H6918_06005 [Sphingomonadaceae bacterium]|nr:hypothetical protein [Sphingomonadaceae bacterium]